MIMLAMTTRAKKLSQTLSVYESLLNWYQRMLYVSWFSLSSVSQIEESELLPPLLLSP